MEKAEIISALMRAKVPMVKRTVYKDNRPFSTNWLIATITKRDRFYRINGKVVSRNMVFWAARAGVAKMEEN